MNWRGFCRWERVAVRAVFGGLITVMASGCGADQAAPTPPPARETACRVQPGAQVFLLRGLWDFFSIGLNDVGQRLRDMGVDATVISGTDYGKLGDELVQRHFAGTLPSPLVLVGHSFGADQAVSLARYLKDLGITVHSMVLLEATIPPPIPSNVDHCVLFYEPTFLADWFPDSFAGNPVVPEAGNDHTRIENLDLRTRTWPLLGPLEYLNYNEHFYADENVDVQNLMIAEIMRTCAPGDEACLLSRDRGG